MIFVICMKPNRNYENKEEFLVLPGDVLKIEVRVKESSFIRLQYSRVPLEDKVFNVSYLV